MTTRWKRAGLKRRRDDSHKTPAHRPGERLRVTPAEIEALYRTRYRDLLRSARRVHFTVTAYDAEDYVQRAMQWLLAAGRHPSMSIYRLACIYIRYARINDLRSRKRQSFDIPYQDPDDSAFETAENVANLRTLSPDVAYEKLQELKAVLEGRKTLHPRVRAAFVTYCIAGVPFRETARQLQMDHGEVQFFVDGAREEIRRLME